MRILYIYPHPDDESFGPAQIMAKHIREGHEVYLLTLTKGGATRQRHKLGYAVDEMGEVRYKEMLDVAETLQLSGMTVLDFPDSGLKEMDPRRLEDAIRDEILRLEPAVVATYPVHGISGFHDHLITHAVVKRVFVELRETCPWLRRLAMVTITKEAAEQSAHFPLSGSTDEEIDCVVTAADVDCKVHQRALDAYRTFQETIDKSGIRDHVGKEAVFELYQESFSPPLNDLFQSLPASRA